MKREAVDRFLSSIERAELRSLTWGYVDGSLTYDQLGDLFEASGSGSREEFDRALDLMIERSLVLEGWAGGIARYRSRFAETVRLLVHLRQVTASKPWDVAPDLVSDYRVVTGPRRVPKRVYGSDATVAAWSATRRWNEQRERAARAYLEVTGAKLSKFQVDVGRAVFDADDRDTGVVVTAGTGAGKTLAYYLPVAIEVAQLVTPTTYWTKSISLYPRVELLKDQMSDVFKIVSEVLTPGSKNRPIRLGALLEPVPNSTEDVAKKWRGTRNGFLCPFLRCPSCEGEIYWAAADLKEGRERLQCPTCPREVGSRGEIGLTRDSLKRQPPDLLFVSAEMVNQRLSDPSFRDLLGLPSNRERRARFLLLDEIHTYGGTTGAQVGGVLRRYRHAVGVPLFVVGLSATLRDAKEFLAELTGVAPQACREVAPADEDLESLSATYQLVLKANSSNRTSVLSTTIQASFLLARMLDNEQAAGTSDGFYGSREFVFLDTLDVTNRLYDDLRDAEGILYTSKHPPLAALRQKLEAGEGRRRDQEGQAWESPERIHGNLSNPLAISRTSSQDAGVDSHSDVVVATPSLEVGFNDPRVGAVVQHRGPRDLATFVQRRGRAGRSVEMRPWMVTVLSEYGRDRLLFQLYEQLFDPTLPARHLPVHNRYVLRIQATLATLDWLSRHIRDSSPMWSALSEPTEWAKPMRTQQAALDILDRLAAGDQRLMAELAAHLRGALQIDERELNALFWLPPRSLLAEAMPTLRRRLATNWKLTDGGLDHHASWHPLPDFTPRALFHDLLVPEVLVLVPEDGKAEDTEEQLPVSQALREFAPGRVSRRLAVHQPLLSHWVEPEESITLETWMPQRELIGRVAVDGATLPLYRPWSVMTREVPKQVSKTSFGALDWRTCLEPQSDGVPLSLPAKAAVARPFLDFKFFLHSRRNPVTVTRFAANSHASRVEVKGSTTSITSTFLDTDGQRAAVGFIQDVDGFSVRLNVPTREELVAAVTARGSSAWRTAFMRYRITTDRELTAKANDFELSWIADAVTLAVTTAGLSGGLAPLDVVLVDPWASFKAAIELMHDAGVGPEVDELAAGAPEQDPSELSARLMAYINDGAFLAALVAHLREATVEPPAHVADWARSQYLGAAGAILLAAASTLLPNRAGVETLVVDHVDDGTTAEVWVTETMLGGGGVVESVAEAFAADPWRFVRGLEAAMGAGNEELLSQALSRSVGLIAADPDLSELAKKVRSAGGHEDRVAALQSLAARLTDRGVSVDQSLLVALNQRIFRVGTDGRLDPFLRDLHRTREDVAAATGIWADLRLFSLAAGAADSVSRRLGPMVRDWRGGKEPDGRILGTSVMATLWPAVVDVRSAALEHYNRFAPGLSFDPEWVRGFCPTYGDPTPLADSEWRTKVTDALRNEGIALLSAPAADARALRGACHELVATPLNLGYLRVYPALAGVAAEEARLVARFEVRELG